MKKITGHLEEKNGKYYAAVNHYDVYGKRKVKWYPLDLEVRAGTKRLFQVMRRGSILRALP